MNLSDLRTRLAAERKRAVSLFAAVALPLFLLPGIAPRTLAASAPISSYFPVYAEIIYDNLAENPDGTKTVLEAGRDFTDGLGYVGSVQISVYGPDYTLLSTKQLDYELPEFGGFYMGEDYNFIAFGDSNGEENDR